MKSFKDYVKTSDRKYHFTAKIACEDLSSDDEKKINESLCQNDMISSEKMFKTPLQENPLDFPNIKNVSVHIIEFDMKYPSSTDVLERLISEATGLQRNCIIVYAENDPRRTYTQEYLDRRKEEFKKKYKPKIGSMYEDEKPEKVELYGEKYNEKLLAHMAREKKKRKDNIVVNALSPKQTTDTVGHVDTGLGPIGTTSPVGSKPRKEQ